MSARRSSWAAFGAVALAVLAVLGPPILRGETALLANPYGAPPFRAVMPEDARAGTYGIRDSWRYTLPSWELTHRAVRGGELPLWNPYVFCGHDHAASIQAAAFSPITLGLAFLPPPWAMTAHLLLHTLLLGLGTAVFLRGRALDGGPAALGGIASALAGYFVAKMGQPTIVATFAWLPWGAASVDALCRTGGRRWLGALGLVLGASALSGHPQVFGLVLLGLAALGLRPFLAACRAGRSRRVALALAGALALGASIAAVQVVAFAAQESTRAALEEDGAGERTTGAPALWGLVVAEPFGSKPLGTYDAGDMTGREDLGLWHAGPLVHPGVVTLCLLPLVWIAARRRWPWTVDALGLAVLAYAVTYVPPLTAAFQALPGVGLSRVDRALCLGAFGTAVAAAGGAQALGSLRARALATWGAGAGGGLALLVALFLVLWGAGSAGAPSAWRSLILAGAVALAAWVMARPRVAPEWRPWALVALLAIDLVPVGARYFTGTPAEALPPRTETTDFLVEHLGSERLAGYSAEKGRQSRTSLQPNLAQLYGLRDVQGFAPLFGADYRRLYSTIEPSTRERDRMVGAVRTPEGLRSGVLDLLGVRFLVATEALEDPGWREVHRAERVRVFERTTPVVRARLVERWVACADEDEVLAGVAAEDFEPGAVAYLLPAADGTAPRGGRGTVEGAVRLVADGLTRVELEVDAPAPGLLLLADAFHPGWRARIDGEPAPVLRADLALRAVEVPAGTSRVTFDYRPRRTLWALTASALAIVASALLVSWPKPRGAP